MKLIMIIHKILSLLVSLLFNAENFYNLIKQESVPWKLFSSATLGRFDIYHSRKNKRHDKIFVGDLIFSRIATKN